MQGLMQFIMARFYKNQNCISESGSSPSSSPKSRSCQSSGSKEQKEAPQPDHEPKTARLVRLVAVPDHKKT